MVLTVERDETNRNRPIVLPFLRCRGASLVFLSEELPLLSEEGDPSGGVPLETLQ